METKIHVLTLALTAVLLARLWMEGLHRSYRAFWAALAFDLITGLALYLARPNSNSYFYLFLATTAIGMVLRYLVLRELCLLVFHDHPGIEAAVRIGAWVSLALAAAIPLAILALARLKADAPFPLLDKFFLFYQSAAFFLTILFTGTVLFVAWFPVPLRRNIVLYCLGFSVKFIGEVALLLFRNMASSGDWKQAASLGLMAVDLTVLAFWLVWLNRSGEQPMVSVGGFLRPDETGAAIRRLNSLNLALSRTLRRNREGGDHLDK